MGMTRLNTVSLAAGCAMATPPEYIDGPSNVMPRRDTDVLAEPHTAQTGTAVAIRWQETPRSTWFRDLVGSFKFGRATPA